MARKSLDWFPFDVSDWLASQSVTLMSLAAQGAYVRLLCYQWRDGSIPADERKLARLLGVSPSEFEGVWDELSDSFEPLVGVPGQLANPRLLDDLKRQMAHRDRLSEAGRAGMSKRWKQGDNEAITTPQPSYNDPITNKREREKKREKESKPKKATVRKPRAAPPNPPRGAGLVIASLGAAFESCVELAAEYDQMCREQKRKPWSETTIKSKIGNWRKMGPESIREALATAVEQGYQGIFPKQVKGQPEAESAESVYKRLTADLGGAA